MLTLNGVWEMQRQGEETLPHSRSYGLRAQFTEIRFQEIINSTLGPRQQTGENRHQHYQSEEQRHSNLIELLYTGLNTPDYDKSTKQQENRVEKQRSVRLRDKIGKLRTEMTGIRRGQRQRKGLEQVFERPASHH